MPEREFFINAIQMVEVDEESNIPTAVLYRPDGAVLIGNRAIADSTDIKFVNEDFKIDLGRYGRGVQTKRRYLTAAGVEKSASEIANDYLIEVQNLAKQWLTARGITECKHLVVAEPLSMHTDEISPEWLANYRLTLRRLLEGKTILSASGVSVRFIPEPFAAFQYYRHGIRHPLVSQRTQMNVLVVDIGGGTCDVCIIETTKEGDISGSGRNKRPLAGKSLPVAGFAINRAIGELIVRKASPQNDAQVKTGLREYRDWTEGNRSFDTLDKKYQYFIGHFHRLVHNVEALKIALSRAVSDWSLEADQRFSAPIIVPRDFFSAGLETSSVVVSVTEFREAFLQKVYLPHFKRFFTDRLKDGTDVLDGAPIDVVLLSGGSANIGWLRELLKADFDRHLSNASFVQIDDYQKVVAQGLAVDCAREFATGSSDFQGVTYNPLYLLLNADDSGCEPRSFQPRTEALPNLKNRPGLLLPSASVMSSFLGKPMQWRVKLNKAPKHTLQYYFLQSSMDPNDIKNLHNVEETRLHTPPHCEFDGALGIQLTLRPDGTATPKFTYRSAGGNATEISKEGRPFFVDMTDATSTGGAAYLGLDFGTSNTAISYIDRASVQFIEARGRDASWKEIGDLVSVLPLPLAVPLARYIGDVRDSSATVPPAFSFLESALCTMAYVAYMDFSAVTRQSSTKLFKSFPHRSSGYLWHLLQASLEQMGRSAVVAEPMRRLLEPKNNGLVNSVINKWAEARHEVSLAESADVLSCVRLLANVANLVFSRYRFGFFQGVQKERFGPRYTGRFRVAHGKPPHSEFIPYVGASAFSEAESFVADPDTGDALSLTPLILWLPCREHRDLDNGHCYFFDKAKETKDGIVARYKAANYACSREISRSDPETQGLVEQIEQMLRQDPSMARHSGLQLCHILSARG